MAQEGEHYGRGEQPPWSWTFESDQQPNTPPQRPPATPPWDQEWPDQPFVPDSQQRAAPLSLGPASRVAGHHRRGSRPSRRIRRIAGGLALVLLGAGIYFGIDRWLLDDGRRSTVT